MDVESRSPHERRRRDPAQRWLDFGCWLAGECSQSDFTRRDGLSTSRYHQLFTTIMDLYFSDIRRDVALLRERWRLHYLGSGPIRRATLEEARLAMVPRFAEVLKLAHSPESLDALAAHQPPNVCKLVKRLRVDFEDDGLTRHPAPPPHVLRVLHVEDSAQDAALIQNLLREEWPHCQFQRVSTRPDFEAALQQEEFNLILSDHSMPNFDGLSALELARRHRPKKPFIFLSGTLGEARAVEAMRRGATDYIVKDHPVRLVAAIREALA